MDQTSRESRQMEERKPRSRLATDRQEMCPATIGQEEVLSTEGSIDISEGNNEPDLISVIL